MTPRSIQCLQACGKTMSTHYYWYADMDVIVIIIYMSQGRWGRSIHICGVPHRLADSGHSDNSIGSDEMLGVDPLYLLHWFSLLGSEIGIPMELEFFRQASQRIHQKYNVV